jgi:hypothetical protein
MSAVAVNVSEALRIVSRRAASLAVAWPAPGSMLGQLVAICSMECASYVVAVAVLDDSVLQDDDTFLWMLDEVIPIRPVPCCGSDKKLFSLDSVTALQVIERGMEAAGLTFPTEQICAGRFA